MRIIPTTDDGWVNFMLLPFRAYGVVVFVITFFVDQRLRDDATILWLLLGHVICLLLLATADAVLTLCRRPGEPRPTWLWPLATLGFTLAFAARFLPELAK